MSWEWYDDLNTKCLFIHCLLKANHKGKKWRGETINKGSFITSRSNLSIETNLSEQQVRTALKKLESTNEITIESTKLNTLISIVNWDKYQGDNQPTNQAVTNYQPSSNQAVTTTNNDNKENNENNVNNKEVGKPPLPKKTIFEIQEKKKEEFLKWLKDVLPQTNYSDQKDELNKFFAYWVEAGPRSKILRWEKEKAFDIIRRLNTWFNNKEKFSPERKVKVKPPKTISTEWSK